MFPCRDYYEEYDEWQYEDDWNYGEEVLVKESFIRGFVRKVLIFILMRL